MKTLLLAMLLMPQDDGFVTLFNGKNLDGWTAAAGHAWVVEDGVIALKGKTDGAEHNGEYLWTKEQYGDFILELEFKVPEKANSGIFIRTSDLQDPVYSGLEVQVANSFGKTETNKNGTAGAIYDLKASSKNPIKASGEWNKVRVECRGPKIAVALNGEAVAEIDLDHWTETGKNPDGTKNKFKKPLKEFARKGYIGLQDHGRPVWYRNIRIKSL